MAKISDELRQFIDDGELFPSQIDELMCIADRIDREMVELPRDMDGVPIHVGDTVWLEDGRITIVDAVEFIQKFGVNIKCFNSKDGYANRSPEKVSHERPDSFERIADELVDAASHADDTCKRLADLAERIRRLAKEGER